MPLRLFLLLPYLRKEHPPPQPRVNRGGGAAHKWTGTTSVTPFPDDLFTSDKAFVLKVCRLLREKLPGIRWSCIGRASTVDREMLSAIGSRLRLDQLRCGDGKPGDPAKDEPHGDSPTVSGSHRMTRRRNLSEASS
jgi:hypothetical protein